MSRFVEHATRILEAAESAMRTGVPVSDTTILIRPDGTLEILSESESPLDTLQMDRGAAMVYRVTHRSGRVRLEGRSGSQTCLFETQIVAPTRFDRLPDSRGSVLLADSTEPRASASGRPTVALPPARIWQPPPEESD